MALFPDNDLVHVFELSANIWMATRSRLESRLKPLSMTWPQFGVLLALAEHDGVTQRDICELLEVDRTTMSVICDSLEKHGWAERRHDPADRRANRVCMTEAGRTVAAEAQRIVWGAYAAVGEALSAEDVAVVVPKLERLYAAVKSVPADGSLG
jgi:MarR family transcriptional regulator, transcriptional regulator for hemolysin